MLAAPLTALAAHDLDPCRYVLLVAVAGQLADAVAERHGAGLGYGVVLIPEGLVEFIGEV